MSEWELALTDEAAKRQVLTMLRERGRVASSGRILMAHPYCVTVLLEADEMAEILRLVRAIDPHARPVAHWPAGVPASPDESGDQAPAAVPG